MVGPPPTARDTGDKIAALLDFHYITFPGSGPNLKVFHGILRAVGLGAPVVSGLSSSLGLQMRLKVPSSKLTWAPRGLGFSA